MSENRGARKRSKKRSGRLRCRFRCFFYSYARWRILWLHPRMSDDVPCLQSFLQITLTDLRLHFRLHMVQTFQHLLRSAFPPGPKYFAKSLFDDRRINYSKHQVDHVNIITHPAAIRRNDLWEMYVTRLSLFRRSESLRSSADHHLFFAQPFSLG